MTHALLCNGNRLEQQAVEKLINQSMARLEDPERYGGPANADKRATEADRVIQRMLHAGMLDRTDHLPSLVDQELESYYSPIPSLLDYNLRRMSLPRAEMDELLKEQKLDHGMYTPMADRFQPTWQEDDEPQ